MRDAKKALLHLPEFVPFRLNRLAVEVSSHLSAIYRDRFGLEIPEWRVLVTVAPDGKFTAQQIAMSAGMHKTRVSRAITSLESKGLVERAANFDDRREMPLQLTKAGRHLYAELVPLAMERERSLLACMSKDELRSFVIALDRLEDFLGLGDAKHAPMKKGA